MLPAAEFVCMHILFIKEKLCNGQVCEFDQTKFESSRCRCCCWKFHAFMILSSTSEWDEMRSCLDWRKLRKAAIVEEEEDGEDNHEKKNYEIYHTVPVWIFEFELFVAYWKLFYIT